MGTERWFAVERIERIDARFDAGQRQCGSPKRADELTKGAFATKDRATAARLHVLAAELRAEAGCHARCAENFHALTMLHYRRREHRLAVTYMRKLMHVAPLMTDPRARMKAAFLAALVFVSVGRGGDATLRAAEGTRIAEALGDASAIARGARIAAAAGNLPASSDTAECGCGRRRIYAECCGAGDEIPVELSLRVHRAGADLHWRGSAWWAPNQHPLDLLMRDPGLFGEPTDWATWKVEEGRYRLHSIPNWYGRSMASARTMAEFARERPNDTTGPTSAVLLSAGAVEAFVNACVHFMGKDHRGRWDHYGIDEKVFESTKAFGKEKSTIVRLRWLIRNLFGKKGFRHFPLKDLERLFDIRNALVHFHADENAALIAPWSDDVPSWMRKAASHRVSQGAPLPYVDRFLNEDLAIRSVDVVVSTVRAFRQAWASKAIIDDLEPDDHGDDWPLTGPWPAEEASEDDLGWAEPG